MHTYTDELQHWGVKGMKWGVRRYQNKDGSLTPAGVKRLQTDRNKQAIKGKDRTELTKERTIPAGTKMYRVSSNKDEMLNGSTYVSYLDVDRNHYKGGYIRSRDGSSKVYEHQYTLQEDLKIPSREKQQEVINQIINSNKKYLRESVEAWVDMAIPKNSWDRWELEEYYDGGIKKYVNDCIDSWKKNTPSQLSYSVSQSLGLAPNVKTEIITTLRKQGYNAMVDEASVGGRNGWAKEGYDPLIVFDSNTLSKNDVKAISERDENAAHIEDGKWQRNVNSSKNGSAQWSAI